MSIAQVGLVVMGEPALASAEGGEWLKGGPSHVCTYARELQDNSPIQDAAQAGLPGLMGRGGGAAPMCLLLTSPSQTGKGGWGPYPIPASPLPLYGAFSAPSAPGYAFPLGHLQGQVSAG